MRMLTLAIALCALIQAGCAADFRAGGERRGVNASASIDPFYSTPPTYYAPPN